MPIYTVRCGCGHTEDLYRALKDYDDLPEHCGERMSRVICAPLVCNDIQPYRSMVTGEIISSRSRHREHLRDHGCIEVGNEKQTVKPLQAPKGLKDTLIEVAADKLRY